jgi:putative intracellular protease/amidase
MRNVAQVLTGMMRALRINFGETRGLLGTAAREVSKQNHSSSVMEEQRASREWCSWSSGANYGFAREPIKQDVARRTVEGRETLGTKSARNAHDRDAFEQVGALRAADQLRKVELEGLVKELRMLLFPGGHGRIQGTKNVLRLTVRRHTKATAKAAVKIDHFL